MRMRLLGAAIVIPAEAGIQVTCVLEYAIAVSSNFTPGFHSALE
jgi:hypothetical protein